MLTPAWQDSSIYESLISVESDDFHRELAAIAPVSSPAAPEPYDERVQLAAVVRTPHTLACSQQTPFVRVARFSGPSPLARP